MEKNTQTQKSGFGKMKWLAVDRCKGINGYNKQHECCVTRHDKMTDQFLFTNSSIKAF